MNHLERFDPAAFYVAVLCAVISVGCAAYLTVCALMLIKNWRKE